MAVPISQMYTVAYYALSQQLRRVERYPLVLMLEPLFRCNLECAGCGKIQYPDHILNRRLTPEQCWSAADECGAPIVSIPGGEPLIHPEMPAIVEGLVKRKKYVYLCTNAILLERKLQEYSVSKYLTFSIHMDGLKEEHDHAVCRDGVYEVAIKAIRAALAKGFRVTTNTTLFDDAEPARVRRFFDEMMELGVEGMMISPGYSYEKAPDQHGFLKRDRTRSLFSQLLTNRKRHWQFNQSPLFLEFLMGKRDYECTPWGNPTYNIFGWQRPCYLLQDGYTSTFQELMEDTDWDRYGTGRHEQCRDCMVHCGYEASAVKDTFSSWGGFLGTVRATLFPNAV
ncbi:MAG: adenosyl-hopene transferase HpnH [Nitrospirota bacterium]|nr:adenosyl-hopene transferase HpnH [Nitrospirota bacterium]